MSRMGTMNLFKRLQTIAVGWSPTGKGGPPSRLQIVLLLVLLIPLSLFLSALITRQSHLSLPVYQPGDIARADIIIPVDALIEDERATQIRRAEVRARALPVYRFDAALPDEQSARLKAAFAQSRALLGLDPAGKPSSGKIRPRFRTLPTAVKEQLRSIIQGLGVTPPVDPLLIFLVGEGFTSHLENQITLVLKDAFSSLLIPDDMRSAGGKEHVITADIVTGKSETIPVSLLVPLAEIHDRLSRQIGQSSLAVASRPHVLRILKNLVTPNLTFDESLTASRQEEDVRNVDQVLRRLKKGKIVLRQGDEVGADQLAQIEALRKLSPAGSSMTQTAVMALLIYTLLTVFVFFLSSIIKTQWSYLRLVGFLILVLSVNLILLEVLWFVFGSVSQSFPASPFKDKAYYFYLLPFAYGSMCVTFLAGERCAQIFTLFFSALAGHSVGTDAYGFFYILITNMLGMIFLRNATQRIRLIAAGFYLGLSSAVLYLFLQIVGQAPLDVMSGSFGASLAFLSGLLNIVCLISTVPLYERIFMVTTEIRLAELGSLNLPLIRNLIRKAPGTYNHSIAVGTLCEGAAKAIGLNPLFLRIAALYHDIGKTFQPEYFVENQKNLNPHERIGCEESARILASHVTGGISAARKARLPSSIVDMIPQHHGTKLMKFFYEKAGREAAASGKEVHEDLFRYPGPKPQTKAAAILMLADAIEAAARTIHDRSQDKLCSLIQKIITDVTEDGQFSECDITLSEINLITSSFLETLSSYYHDRIAYPGFDFEEQGRADGSAPQ